jgi:predicted ATPase
MQLLQFAVQNYKSLRGIRLEPSDLTVIVGANAAGKTNLAESLDFVSEVYRHGLEVAVARKGGYENIAFRRMRRSKGAIEIEIIIQVPANEANREFPPSLRLPADLLYRHRFAFATVGQSIRAEFQVLSESLSVQVFLNSQWHQVVSIERNGNAIEVFPSSDQTQLPLKGVEQGVIKRFFEISDLRYIANKKRTLSPSELFITSIGRFTLGLHSYIAAASGIRVFQISPTRSRSFGVPTPRPELEGSGSNLPAVVDLLRKSNKKQWQLVMETMRSILPKLRDITVNYTSQRTLGLFFEEEGVGRPWSVEEVSDGTIQTLALLVAIFDARYTALVIEEPENSIHPWIIRHILDACKNAGPTKQIIITTHSPLVINSVPPEKLQVMWRADGESHLAPISQLDPNFLTLWNEGQVASFDYLDSGALPLALPPSPST